MTSFSVPGSNVLAGMAYAETGAWSSFAATIPFDDTIPQITEGAQILSVAYTPKVIGNRVVIFGQTIINNPNANTYAIMSLFKSGQNDALVTTWLYDGNGVGSGNAAVELNAMGSFTVAAISALTLSMRVGCSTGGTMQVNGTGVARLFGGTAATRLLVQEFKP